jgi:hypothetical protein
MVGKRIQIDDATWSALDLLGREKHRSFQQLADEAFSDLLAKHQRPADLRAQLKQSQNRSLSRRSDQPNKSGK